MSANKQNTRLLAQTFFNQLRESGYTPMQVVGMATELLDLVTEDIKVHANVAQATAEGMTDFRQEA
ncbi:hypothetical protein [Melittangium boletus]|uniref:Uncharacterized protein n=1 Tax=Melittangium boletus DSM 14713 TaxID=1294270 RepID=A0A250I6T4_9BACT|nr:hypothetical protein [Melittangium boletus]ATB26910.1 hypothetical protein MEBOL_000345 [Melittangium boletus DSM 14713]